MMLFSFLFVGYVLLSIGYAFLVKKLYDGFIEMTDRKAQKTSQIRKVSILVPFRNEEENIAAILCDLFSQTYPTENFEILLLNDHSEDRSMAVAEEVLKSSLFSKCTFVHPAQAGKKAAITEGVKQASGEIILTIDADCRVHPDWLKSVNAMFVDDTVKMVFGPVRIEPTKTIFQAMQAIEFASLIGSGVATVAYGIPTMSNGANLAYKKEVFTEVGGFEGNFQIASGDDEFLMRKIVTKYKDGIRFNNYEQSIVSTSAQRSLSTFIDQRIRWAGKWRAHNDYKSKLLAVFIFLFHLAVLAVPFFVTSTSTSLVLFGIFLSAKAYVEYRFLRIVNFWLKVPWSWPAFILLQLTYSLYAVVIGVAALFVKPVWKGRKIKL